MKMNFGDAIKALKEGKKVARSGWNGKGMYLFYCPGCTLTCDQSIGEVKNIAVNNGGNVEVLPTTCMKTADDKLLIGWSANQIDMLSDDWVIVE